jgi:hypothetical protein
VHSNNVPQEEEVPRKVRNYRPGRSNNTARETSKGPGVYAKHIGLSCVGDPKGITVPMGHFLGNLRKKNRYEEMRENYILELTLEILRYNLVNFFILMY